MLDEGLSIEAVDKALLKKGFPVGPITVMDQVGLDIAAHVTESSRGLVAGRRGVTVNEGVVKMHADGRLGRKGGKGFYTYSDKGKKQGVDSSVYQYFKGSGTVSLPIEEIQDRAVMQMLNEAVMCLEEGLIASPSDGDLGAVFGIGFLPFTGGPFRAIDTWGVQHVVDRMNELKDKYGDRFTPRPMLVAMAAKGAKFHES